MGDEELKLRLLGYRTTTAEIVYRLPDHPRLLQTFVWQQLDRAPEFPRLKRFLAFWQRSIDGRLYTVRVARASGLCPQDIRLADMEFRVH